MKSEEITVSYIVTLFNKEPYIAATLRSLLEQRGDFRAEYILVDDVSTDASVKVVEEIARGREDIIIVRNSTNVGPSIRLNQGAKLARGRYLQFMDSDDILASDATHHMLVLARKNNADLVYAGWARTEELNTALLGRAVPTPIKATVSDTPLEYVLTHRFVRMTCLVERELFLRAGGADEKIFIQDESLALRLAAAARRFVHMHAPVVYVPHVEGNLGGNIAQRNHDRFLANRNMLQAGATLSQTAQALLYRRCISAAWKQERSRRGLRAATGGVFRDYLFSRLLNPAPNESKLNQYSAYFAALEGVRRAA